MSEGSGGGVRRDGGVLGRGRGVRGSGGRNESCFRRSCD